MWRDLVADCWGNEAVIRPTFYTCCERLVDMAWDLAPEFALPPTILIDIFEKGVVQPTKAVPLEAVPQLFTSDPLFSTDPLFKGDFLRQIVPKEETKPYSLLTLGRQTWCGNRDGSIAIFDAVGGFVRRLTFPP